MIGVAPSLIVLPIMIVFATIVGAFWVGLAGYAALCARRQRDDLVTAADLHRHRDYELLRRRACCATSLKPQQALDQAASATPIWSAKFRAPTSIGASRSAYCSASLSFFLLERTTFGFAARVTGGNFRAALAQGLPVGRLIVACSAIAGACAGLAGFFEVAAIQGRANASLAAGYGFTGILVSFLARHNPLVIPPVAILFGGLVAAGGLIQRRMGLPDATVQVLEGLIFVVLLTSETLYGRFSIFKPRAGIDRT